MTRRPVPAIGGQLDMLALADLCGDEARMRAFRLLPLAQQHAAIRELARQGLTAVDISRATRLPLHDIMSILGPG